MHKKLNNTFILSIKINLLDRQSTINTQNILFHYPQKVRFQGSIFSNPGVKYICNATKLSTSCVKPKIRSPIIQAMCPISLTQTSSTSLGSHSSPFNITFKISQAQTLTPHRSSYITDMLLMKPSIYWEFSVILSTARFILRTTSEQSTLEHLVLETL